MLEKLLDVFFESSGSRDYTEYRTQYNNYLAFGSLFGHLRCTFRIALAYA